MIVTKLIKSITGKVPYVPFFLMWLYNCIRNVFWKTLLIANDGR